MWVEHLFTPALLVTCSSNVCSSNTCSSRPFRFLCLLEHMFAALTRTNLSQTNPSKDLTSAADKGRVSFTYYN